MKQNFDRLRAVSGVLVVIVVTCAAACQQRSASTSENIRPIRLTTSVPLSYANIVDHVAPAVVTVHSARRVKAVPVLRRSLLPAISSAGACRGIPAEHSSSGRSGVIVRSDGHILTNQHMVDGAQEIKVDLGDRRALSAKRNAGRRCYCAGEPAARAEPR